MLRSLERKSIDDQFTTLAASIFACRNSSAIPFGSVEGLLDSLRGLTITVPQQVLRLDWVQRRQGAGVQQALLVVAVCPL